MSKSITNQRLIYKIHSSRFSYNNWNLKLDFDEARKNEEVVSLGDSIALRMIRQITNNNITEEEINDVKRKKKKSKNKDNIIKLNKKLNKMKFEENYIVIVFDNTLDWNYAKNKKKDVILNGDKFVRCVGTNGGIKNNSVVFVKESIHSELDKRLNNSRNTLKKYVPAKFEAYKSLAFSSSTPVTQPRNILVIKDGVNKIREDVLKLSDNGKGGFDLHEEKNCEIEINYTDGCGMIRPSLIEQWAIDLGEYHIENGKKVANYIPSGANIRNFATKGMVAPIPYDEYGDEIGEYLVEDVWGNMVDIRKVDLILTDNMVKLWDAYNSCEEFMNACKENGFEFCVAKLLPKELESVRNMNYQFLQSYELSDEDLDELLQPTIDTIKGAIGLTCDNEIDYGKMLLFLKGKNITKQDFLYEDNDYIKALMLNKEMANDPYIKQKVHNMIKKRIEDSKKGVIQINGNYSVILGDLYAMLQHMFKQPVTGCLGKGEYYSKTWFDKGVNEFVMFRAPMTIHNNIVKAKNKTNEIIEKYFRYIKVCIVFNIWGSQQEALNGCDFDSDAVISTDNKVLLRMLIETLTVICEQNSTEKVKITESLLAKANKNGFGNNVGKITNRCTAMFDVLAKFEKGTKEYEEMKYRITCMQGYQQEIIDSCKGIIPKEVPSDWYDYKVARDIDDDGYSLSLLANKKPYFFIYNYKHLKNELNKHNSSFENNCYLNFGISLKELIEKENKTEEEQKFVEYYYNAMPVSCNNSTMNRICWKLEKEFDGILKAIKETEFDTSIFTTDKKVPKKIKENMEVIYNEYKNDLNNKMKTMNGASLEDKTTARQIFIEQYKERIEELCNGDYEIITNCLVELLYNKPVSKQFVWSICRDYIINKLIKDNNNNINIPVRDNDGNIEWNGERYSIVQERIDEIE